MNKSQVPLQKQKIPRSINLLNLLSKKSHFLFGPRSTGKSTAIGQQLGDKAVIVNLLRSSLLSTLIKSPGELEGIIDATTDFSTSMIVIDEIQKVPALLDEVHRLIEERSFRFLLSGSSARQLKATGVNLLGGRAWISNMFPLTTEELKADFRLDHYLRYGGLPHVYTSSFPQDELEAYITTYLNEEIKMEGLVRKIPAFLEFLRLAALTNTQLLNFSTIASDTGVSATTIKEYYSILEDTLIGKLLQPWTKSIKRKAVATAKFYFFDTGVCHTLAETKSLERNSDLYGQSFEQLIFMEISAYLSYRNRKEKLRFWRSQDRYEVDFTVGDEVAIEVKSTKKVHKDDFRGVNALREEGIFKSFFIVSNDPVDIVRDGVHCLNWKVFLKRLWADQILKA
jgi:predicted AAA+ superfamily ATPase